MFSGIKSMIFGYSSEPEATSVLTSESNEGSISGGKTAVLETSTALIEQTLNAATSKLTEQLLPQSPSIEQLQSSSHQLLPTLIEQHEEDECKRKKELKVEIKEENVDDDDDDDECLIADSWELLDFEKSPEDKTNSLSLPQMGEESLNKQAGGGILKQTNSNADKLIKQHGQQQEQLPEQVAVAQLCQKPKVSFELYPDLVKVENQKIDRLTLKVAESNTKPATNKAKNKKKCKQAKLGPLRATTPAAEKATNVVVVSTAVDADADHHSSKAEEIFPSLSSSVMIAGVDDLQGSKQVVVDVAQQKAGDKLSRQRKVPVLNYAAALSLKLDSGEKKEKERKDVGVKDQGGSSSLIDANAIVNFQTSGAIKRNRPVSTSSWSSSDEIETIDSKWDKVYVCDSGIAPNSNENSDHESIISSGFSDCDYGYEAINDYVMRLKKSSQNNKRRGVSSKSNSLVSSMSKRGNEQVAAGGVASASKQQQETLMMVKSSKVVSKQQIKPKKKKMVMSASDPQTSSSSSSDFLKKTVAIKKQETNDHKRVEKQATKRGDHCVVEIDQVAADLVDSRAFLKPEPVINDGSNNSSSGQDSSDIAEMDESWYVTPPPCFTGANKLSKNTMKQPMKQARAGEVAARENALIEHPSIYIASTSKQAKVVGESVADEKPIQLAKQKAIVLRKVSTAKQVSTSSSEVATSAKTSAKQQAGAVEAKQQKKSVNVIAMPREKKSAKAWANKFIVTNWDQDEQDDINDFDNLFVVDEQQQQQQPKQKPSKSLQKVKKQQKVLAIEDIDEVLGDGYDSDFSLPSSPVLVGVTPVGISTESVDLDESLNEISGDNDNDSISLLFDEDQNCEPTTMADDLLRSCNKQTCGDRKAPTQKRPIEPERQPGWQLRRKRSRRRPLSASMVNTCNAAVAGSCGKASIARMASKAPNFKRTTGSCEQSTMPEAAVGSSASSSARSTPSSFIDRIGSSIVANLSNLTNGFPAVGGTMPMASRAAMEDVEKLTQSVVRKSDIESQLVARRRMSKAYLDRQNDCVKFANSNRRSDRRLKMHSTLNGSSVNRKVHTNFH